LAESPLELRRVVEAAEANLSATLEGLSAFDVAMTQHLDWLKEIHHALLLGEPFNSDDLSEEAEHRCQFGHWYDNEAPDSLRGVDLFAALGSSHKAVHASARTLLTRQARGIALEHELLAEFMDRALVFGRDAQRLHIEVLTGLALRDPLTGALNRYLMQKHLHAEWARFQRFGQSCAVALLDLDRFKDVNDKYGHAMGDAVLSKVATTLDRHLRGYDNVFFRFGGEEFLLCLPEISAKSLPLALERLRQAVENLRLKTEEGQRFQVTASIGAAFFESDADVDAALSKADRALYLAKQRGRNRVEIARL
jgi:diguanylate cyclase (GGDEF)-like protein